MANETLSLFKVTKAHASWTIVAAESRRHAEEAASKLEDDAFENKPLYSAVRLIQRKDLPDTWEGALPFIDPDHAGNELELECQTFFPEPSPSIDPNEQHALYQSLNGSSLLRPPKSKGERTLYEQFGVLKTGDGIYFTTLKPLPIELEEVFVCLAIRPDASNATEPDA